MQKPILFDTLPPALPLSRLLLILAAVAVGTLAAVVVLPVWLPGLSHSLLGVEPQAYWYLSRASGFVSYGLLWLSIVLGLLITNRTVKLWPGGALAFDLHQYISLLGLAFALFHGLILLGDQYIDYTLMHLLVPFASADYKPLAVGMGQVAFWLMLLLALSFSVRQHIGWQVWRTLHMSSFAVFLLALLYGITSGTDSGTAWAAVLYWISGGSVLFLTVYRILMR